MPARAGSPPWSRVSTRKRWPARLDARGSARRRREHYVQPWLPEPLVAQASDRTADQASNPADQVTLDERVTFAPLVVLDRLSPAERTAFVLHDVFDLGSPEIAEVGGRSPAAV